MDFDQGIRTGACVFSSVDARSPQFRSMLLRQLCEVFITVLAIAPALVHRRNLIEQYTGTCLLQGLNL